MITASSVARFMRLSATLHTITTSTERDGMNRPVEVDSTETVLCWIAPEHAGETNDGRQVGTTRFDGYFPPCTGISATSRVTLGTAEYEVDGPPALWTHPLTCEDVAVVAKLIRTV